jgi:hypothetical protein
VFPEGDNDGGYLATIDRKTKLPQWYYGDTSSKLSKDRFSVLQFPYSFKELTSEGQNVNLHFSIQYSDESPLFPYASTFQFVNPAFKQCDNMASFCTTLTGNTFKLRRDVEAYYGDPPRVT